MASRSRRLLTAAIVPAVALWIAAWFDGNVVNDAIIQEGHDYDITPVTLAFPIAYLIAMAGALAVAAVAWWVRDRIVGLVYLVVGGFVLFDGFLVAKFGMSVNGASPAAPEPIAHFLNQLMQSSTGRTDAALVVAAAMVLAGIGSLALAGRAREEPAAT